MKPPARVWVAVLLQAARERQELVSFLREHGPAIVNTAAPSGIRALSALLERFAK